MNYCHFDSTSDLCAYEEGARINIQVAQCRVGKDSIEEEKISHLDAGRTFHFNTPCEAISKIQAWRAEGVLLIPASLERTIYHSAKASLPNRHCCQGD